MINQFDKLKNDTLNYDCDIKIKEINCEIDLHKTKLIQLKNELENIKKNRLYECSNCNNQMIEKNIVVIEQYSFQKSYNSYEDSHYNYHSNFIVCEKCNMWLSADGIKYPKSKEKMCEELNEIPERCKPYIKQINDELQEKIAKKQS